MSDHPITVKRLASGYFHIRGVGLCNWAQPPHWPCDEPTFRAHTFEEAGEEFISAALTLRPWGRYDDDDAYMDYAETQIHTPREDVACPRCEVTLVSRSNDRQAWMACPACFYDAGRRIAPPNNAETVERSA